MKLKTSAKERELRKLTNDICNFIEGASQGAENEQQFIQNLLAKSLRDAAKTIECVSNHMLDNGVFLLSIYLPDPSFLIRDQNILYPATDYFFYKSSQCRIMENNNYDENSSINTLFWYLEIDGVLQEEKYSFKQKMYYPHEMDILFENSSLNIIEKLGSYDGSKMNDLSTMQIYICEKST